MAWLWHAMAPWAVPTLKAYLKVKTVEGKHHVPKKGAAILASNHLSALDHLVLPTVTKRVIYNISKAEHFEKPIKRFFMTNWGVIPLKRGTGDSGALEQAKDVLRKGNLFCIYPEGTRSLDGKLHKGHTGVARIALEMNVPVIPVAMLGTFEKKPKGMKGMNKKVKTGARVGEPLSWPQYAGMHTDREICRKVTDEIMHAIAAVSGQEYVDEYQHNPEVPGYDRK
ncbi:MAG: lysophospholipid acyltransferase family protein [Thermoplasmatota archaeon]